MPMENFNSVLIKLKEAIKESRVEEILLRKNENLEGENNAINFLEEINSQKIIENLQKTLEIISDFISPKGIIKGLFNNFANDIFGSIYEMRINLMNDYKCIDNFLTTKDKNILET